MLNELMERYPSLRCCEAEIERARDMILDTYRRGGKILVCGNGGSAADSDHIVGELMKGFILPRKMDKTCADKFKDALGDESEELVEKLQRGIPAISLPAQSVVLSAYINDVDADLMYAQLVFGYARPEDMLIAISSSGNSRNVVAAAKVAGVMGMKTLALTGEKESKLSAACDCTVRVPETETFKVQELHLPVYHYLCAAVEKTLFGD
ncbi:MAG: SIS domain-containing protein [Ruminococcaceae bacterium]|nr:SIS domain-containing protein [Oscillospiraceae bacterium]